jgi:hypothetical protein
MMYSVNDIYNKALSFMGDLNDPLGNFDYAERAPYIIASFCSNARSTDKALRKINGLPDTAAFSRISIALLEQFPLCDELVHPASLYLAAMLIADDNPDLSDTLYDQYCDFMATLAASLGSGNKGILPQSPAACESISEKYFFD